jgi:hypothetical protein
LESANRELEKKSKQLAAEADQSNQVRHSNRSCEKSWKT